MAKYYYVAKKSRKKNNKKTSSGSWFRTVLYILGITLYVWLAAALWFGADVGKGKQIANFYKNCLGKVPGYFLFS